MNDVTALDIVTLVIAVLGLVLSIIGLTLRVAEYLRSGSRIDVDLSAGASGGSAAAVITWPVGREPPANMPPGYTKSAFIVTVRNRGHGATTVDRVAIDIGGTMVSQPEQPFGMSAPHRLEGESSVPFVFDGSFVIGLAQSVGRRSNGRVALCAVITLGSGQTVESASRTVFAPDD